MALGEALSAPLQPALEDVRVTPPAGGVQVQSPQVVEQNKGLWRGFFQKLKEDPNFKQAVLMTGIQMLKSPKMGETGWDVASNALQGGVMTLEGLRQRDFEREQAKKAQELQGRQVAVQERGATTQEKTAETYRAATEGQTNQAQQAYQLKREELQEAVRSNQAREKILQLQAEADMLRARAYSDGGARGRHTPAEIQKINMLTAQYVSQGMDEVQARAHAIEYLTETGKAKSPQDRIRIGLDNRVKAYNSSLAALDTPLTGEMMKQFLQEEIAMEQTLSGLAAPPAASGPGSVRMFDRPKVDPQLLAQVRAAVQSGKDVTAIRQRIIQLGHDPAAYGL